MLIFKVLVFHVCEILIFISICAANEIVCRTVAFVTLIQSFVKINPACLCVWAVNRNGRSDKSYFYAHYAGSGYCMYPKV
jgi:hypothetical protein